LPHRGGPGRAEDAVGGGEEGGEAQVDEVDVGETEDQVAFDEDAPVEQTVDRLEERGAAPVEDLESRRRLLRRPSGVGRALFGARVLPAGLGPPLLLLVGPHRSSPMKL
jgi:hypothetical protein